ncbi:MAG: GNAT family N-acetyltransferase [Blastocatellia bacterium]|nr:GNAT family N-acetyltransferase [Blastocatellia bacterium]
MHLNHSIVAATEEYPIHRSAIPPVEIDEGGYLARFAKNRQELDSVFKLRFEVFNLELEEGLDSSFQTGRDQDEFDLDCHHLIVLESSEERIVGTYRVQTAEMAESGRGFYSAGEFDLSNLPLYMLENAVELGRACIDRTNRSPQVLFLLWKGIAAYMVHNRKRYLFGCCSLTSQDAHEGKRVMELVEEGGYMHPSFFVTPKEGFECYPEGFRAEEKQGSRGAEEQGSKGAEGQGRGEEPQHPSTPAPLHVFTPAPPHPSTPAYPPAREVHIPRLFNIYLRYGARVCGPPAIDRSFKTIDFFVVFDIDEMNDQARRAFFGV